MTARTDAALLVSMLEDQHPARHRAAAMVGSIDAMWRAKRELDALAVERARRLGVAYRSILVEREEVACLRVEIEAACG